MKPVGKKVFRQTVEQVWEQTFYRDRGQEAWELIYSHIYDQVPVKYVRDHIFQQANWMLNRGLSSHSR